MTLPTSFPLSMSQIATELGLALPLSISHPWVIELAGKNSLPVSFSDLLGKTGRMDGAIGFTQTGQFTYSVNIATPFFGVNGHFLSVLGWNFNSPAIGFITFATDCNLNGNISVRNNTTGIATILVKQDSTHWQAPQSNSNWIRVGQSDNYTILPSN